MMSLLQGAVRRNLLAAICALAVAATAHAAPPEDLFPDVPPGRSVPFAADSGVLENASERWATVHRITAGDAGSSWIRVFFGPETHLPPGSTLRIKSMLDGAVQHLTAETLQQWQRSSAYFNGDEVVVELIAAPRSLGNRVTVQRLHVGAPEFVPESLCGIDDRVFSADPRAARLLNGGCTGWLINECFLSAGHCVEPAAGNSVVEFNVPLSEPTSSGLRGLNHPPPSDQYFIDTTALQFEFTSGSPPGDDWGYFAVFANTETGLTPLQAQGDHYTLATNVPTPSGQDTRLTGYGLDPGIFNLVQQTEVGPFQDFSGTTLQYEVDTTGGNSGSAVVDEASGLAFGIHTTAGCDATPPPYNRGTAINQVPLQAALRNPPGSCASQPACDNDGACEAGEDCYNCVADCVHHPPGGVCGDGVCDLESGEDCDNCPDDCNFLDTGDPADRFCCGQLVLCADPRCTGNGNTCSEDPANGQGYCCGDGICEGGEDLVNCALDCGVCIPTAEVMNLQIVHGPGSDITLTWDAAPDPCFDHYVVLGSNDPTLEIGFTDVATNATTTYVATSTWTFYLVVVESATGDRGPLGHYGQ